MIIDEEYALENDTKRILSIPCGISSVRWISVDERLPEVPENLDRDYPATNGDMMFIACLKQDYWGNVQWWSNGRKVAVVSWIDAPRVRNG